MADPNKPKPLMWKDMDPARANRLERTLMQYATLKANARRGNDPPLTMPPLLRIVKPNGGSSGKT